MKYNYITIVFGLILSFLLSCNRGHSTEYDPDSGSFIRNIETQYSEININSINNLGFDSTYQPAWLLSYDDCDQLIVGDPLEKIIVLLNKNGSELSRAGGEGRGPGEFQSTLDLHIGNDNRLYIIDGLEFRISIYRIREKQFEYIESIPFKNPSNYYLNSIYVTDFGNFGIFQVSEGYFTPENRFLLYRLDDHFAPVEQLLEMPGHGRQKFETPHFTFYTPFKYLNRTIWYLDNEWFYYITTRESIVHKYNVRTGKQEEITFLQLGDRDNNQDFIQSVKNYYPDEDDEFWTALEQIDKLPLFDGLLADGNKIYLTLLPSPGIDGLILVLNLESEEIKYFRVPQEFVPGTICGDSIFGINFRINEDYQIMNIEPDSN